MQNKSTPLHMAVEAKYLTCAQLLIEKKANVNTSDKVRSLKHACPAESRNRAQITVDYGQDLIQIIEGLRIL